MDLDWATKLVEIHYGKKAEEMYAEYLAQFSDEEDRADAKEKVMDILKYEDANPEYVEQTNEFLSPLDQQAVVELKHIMYTSEEPHRKLAMKYLDRFEIVILTEEVRDEKDITSDGEFRYWENAIYLEIENLRDDKRGDYYTYFHEVAHAFDYYYAQENKEMLQEIIKDDDELEFDDSTFFSDVYKIDDKTLNDYMYEDVENNFRKELAQELESSKYNHLNAKEKQDMIDNVTENLLEQNKLHKTLTQEEKKLQMKIEEFYEDVLHGPDNNTASDVYGGVTNKTIEGNYNHGDDYWLEKDGTRIREPNKEGFAEYYARIMAPDGEDKPGIKSTEKFLFTSKQQMDEYFKHLYEGDLQ